MGASLSRHSIFFLCVLYTTVVATPINATRIGRLHSNPCRDGSHSCNLQIAKTFKSSHPVGSNARFGDFLHGATDAANRLVGQLATRSSPSTWKPHMKLANPITDKKLEFKVAMASLSALLNPSVDSMVTAQARVGLPPEMASTIGQRANMSRFKITVSVVVCAIVILVAGLIGTRGVQWGQKLINRIKIQINAGTTFKRVAEQGGIIDEQRRELDAVNGTLGLNLVELGIKTSERDAASAEAQKNEQIIQELVPADAERNERLLLAQKQYLELLTKTAEYNELTNKYTVQLERANHSKDILTTLLTQDNVDTNDNRILWLHQSLKGSMDASLYYADLRRSVTAGLAETHRKLVLALAAIRKEGGNTNQQVTRLLKEYTAGRITELATLIAKDEKPVINGLQAILA